MSVYRPGTNKSSILNYPTIRPTLDLDFANSKTLDPRITFARSSGGSYVGPDGLIKYAGVNEARFDHNPTTGESLGLLVEEGRTNLITYSEDFSQYDTIDNVTVTTNQIVAPDGTTTADKLISTISGGANTAFIQKNQTVSIDTSTYVMSVFLKAGTSPQTLINLQLAGGTYQQSRATINWTSNTITLSDGGTAFLTPYPNGWYRVSITLTNNGTNNTIGPRIYVRGQGNDNVNGEFVYAWGLQVEQGAFPTSYIPTGASTKTREFDDVQITGRNFSSFYNQSEGSVRAKFKFYANHGPYSEAVSISGVAGAFMVIDVAGGLVTDCYGGNTVVTGGNNARNEFITGIRAYKFSTNDSVIGCSGAASITTQTGKITNPNPTAMWIGRRGGGGLFYSLNGHIKNISYYPKRLPNAQLQALTR